VVSVRGEVGRGLPARKGATSDKMSLVWIFFLPLTPIQRITSSIPLESIAATGALTTKTGHVKNELEPRQKMMAKILTCSDVLGSCERFIWHFDTPVQSHVRVTVTRCHSIKTACATCLTAAHEDGKVPTAPGQKWQSLCGEHGPSWRAYHRLATTAVKNERGLHSALLGGLRACSLPPPAPWPLPPAVQTIDSGL